MDEPMDGLRVVSKINELSIIQRPTGQEQDEGGHIGTRDLAQPAGYKHDWAIP